MSLLALGGALLTALCLYVLANRGGFAGGRLILIGIGVAAMLQSVVAYVLSRAAAWDLQTAMQWLTGSLNGATWARVVPLAIVCAVVVTALLVLGRDASVLRLGDDTAAALGVHVHRTRLSLLVAAVVLLAFATAAAGPIAFVAFMAGPIAARLVGPGASLVVPAGLVGALLVLVADLAGQYAFDHRYPVGVITGVLGAPYLVVLLVAVQPIRRIAVTATHQLAADAITLAYGDRPVVESLDLTVAPGGSPRSSAPTAAASRRCCERWPDCSPRARARSRSTATNCTDAPPRRSPASSDCCRRLRSPPRASPSPTSSAAAATRTNGPCRPGTGATTRPSRERWRRPRRSTSPTAPSTNSPAVSDSGCGSRWRSPRRPTSCCSTSRPRFLDVAHQIEVLDLLTDLNQARGTTIVMVLHDLNLAARYADHLIAMRHGRIHAAAPPRVITSELVRDVFGLECRVIIDPLSGAPLVLPCGRHHTTQDERYRAGPLAHSAGSPSSC